MHMVATAVPAAGAPQRVRERRENPGPAHPPVCKPGASCISRQRPVGHGQRRPKPSPCSWRSRCDAARMPWLVAVLFVTLATTAAAPVRTGPATGRIAGHVRDGQGAPIAHAQVFVVGTALSAITDTSGAFLLPAVPAGTVTVRAARTGYAFAEGGGTVRAGATLTLNFTLATRATMRSNSSRPRTKRRPQASPVARDEERRAGDAQGRARLRRQRRHDRRGTAHPESSTPRRTMS